MKEIVNDNILTNAKRKQEEGEEMSREMNKSKYEKKPIDTYVPPVSFHKRLKEANSEFEFSKFIKHFKFLHINISFIYAILKVPSYARFLKEIITCKRKIEDHEVIALSKGCSSKL